MIVNLALGSTTPKEQQQIIYDLAKDMLKYYHVPISPSNLNELVNDPDMSAQFRTWVNDHYCITVVPFRIGTLSRGFNIHDDQHFTKYLLSRENK